MGESGVLRACAQTKRAGIRDEGMRVVFVKSGHAKHCWWRVCCSVQQAKDHVRGSELKWKIGISPPSPGSLLGCRQPAAHGAAGGQGAAGAQPLHGPAHPGRPCSPSHTQTPGPVAARKQAHQPMTKDRSQHARLAHIPLQLHARIARSGRHQHRPHAPGSCSEAAESPQQGPGPVWLRTAGSAMQQGPRCQTAGAAAARCREQARSCMRPGSPRFSQPVENDLLLGVCTSPPHACKAARDELANLLNQLLGCLHRALPISRHSQQLSHIWAQHLQHWQH